MMYGLNTSMPKSMRKWSTIFQAEVHAFILYGTINIAQVLQVHRRLRWPTSKVIHFRTFSEVL